MSYASGIKTEPGDEFEIEAPTFGKPLRNRMVPVPDEGLVTVTPAVSGKGPTEYGPPERQWEIMTMGLKRAFLKTGDHRAAASA